MRKSYFLVIVSLILNYSFSKGQINADSVDTSSKSEKGAAVNDSTIQSDCQIRDVNDIIYSIFKKKNSKDPHKEDKKVSLLIIPSFTVSPANGLMYGVNSTGSWAFGDRKSTRLSMATAKVVYTTENQFMSYLKTSIYTKENKYFLNGDYKFYIYSLPTYGLGTNAPDTSYQPNFSWSGFEVAGTGNFPMTYNYVVIHQTVNRKLVENVYLGLGYQLDAYSSIVDKILNLDTIPVQITPHWAYSHYYGIDSSRYALSGFSANFMYDSRDNLINPYKGYFINVNFRYNSKFLGSTEETTQLYMEFRTYVSLSKEVQRHLIAFWFFGNFNLSGRVPYYTMMALGDDQKGTSGRGYIAGRYRGENLVYGEVEYRFPFSKCKQTIGGVVFLNAVSTTNLTRGVYLFDYVRPALGFGIRVLMNKSVRLNISIDYAMGYRSKGFYFNSGDAF